MERNDADGRGRPNWSLLRCGSVLLLFGFLIGYQYGSSTAVTNSNLVELRKLNQLNLNQSHVGNEHQVQVGILSTQDQVGNQNEVHPVQSAVSQAPEKFNQPNLDQVGTLPSIPTLSQSVVLIKSMPKDTPDPPNVVELHDQSLPDFVRHRHTCISHIREAHFRTLGPYIRSDTDRTLYIDPAYHENIGDTMLSMATHWFFAQLNQEVMPCHCVQALKLHPKCDKEMFDKAETQNYRVAAWHAGGK